MVQFTSSNDTLFTEVDKQNARPSKVLTTERLVFFSDDYEIESGQGNDTASVQRDRTPGLGKSSRPRGSSFFSDVNEI